LVAEEGIVAEEVVVAEEEVALDCEAIMSWQLHMGKYVGGKPQGDSAYRFQVRARVRVRDDIEQSLHIYVIEPCFRTMPLQSVLNFWYTGRWELAGL